MHHIIPTLATKNVLFKPLNCDFDFAEKALGYLEAFHQDVERHAFPAFDLLRITSLADAFATAHNIKRQLNVMAQAYAKVPELLGKKYSSSSSSHTKMRIAAVTERAVRLFGEILPESKGHEEVVVEEDPKDVQ